MIDAEGGYAFGAEVESLSRDGVSIFERAVLHGAGEDISNTFVLNDPDGTISVGGAVKRPAIYEIKGKATIADAVHLAGGLAPDADGSGAILERIDGDRQTMSADLTDTAASKLEVHSGDTLVVRGWNEGKRVALTVSTEERPNELCLSQAFAVIR